MSNFLRLISSKSLKSSTYLYNSIIFRSQSTSHRNILPTYHFQNCLPKLPIPKLEDSINKYLVSVAALKGHPECREEDLWETKRLCNFLLKIEGPELQQLLIDKDARNKHTSYITEPWFDMYLESRLPLPLNYNPFMLFKRDPCEEQNDASTRATNMIISALKFKKSLESEKLAPEVFYLNDKAKSIPTQVLVKCLPSTAMIRYLPMAYKGAYPLDMSQFKNLLSSTRIPCKGKDQLTTYKDSKHIIVLYQGYFYNLKVINDDGSFIDPIVIKSHLKSIMDQNLALDHNSISFLTTTDRDTWADTRDHLLNIGNKSALDQIDSGIFCLVLEPDTDSQSPTGSVSNFLHGPARWFDKSFSLVVTGNGDVALNFEHAWGDGVAVVRFFNEVFADSTQNPALVHTDDVTPSQLSPITFNLDERAKNAISDARTCYDVTRGSLHAAGGVSEDTLSKNFLKEKKVSPDGVVQLAIQLGHLYVHGHPAPTYESCSTSAFKHGRTETVRSCTLESVAAANAIAISKSRGQLTTNREVLGQLIRDSCTKHNNLTRDAAMGHGFDRHLFALRHTAQMTSSHVPSLFQSDLYELMNSIVLSTSTLNSDAIQFGGFAPVTSDGYGIGYGVRDQGVGCNVTSYHSNKADDLSNAIMQAYRDLHEILI